MERAWKEDGRFALLHDLTNCLRIGDVTVCGDDEAPRMVEVKTNSARRSPQQQRRIREAERALRGAGPPPGKDAQQHLVDLDIPLKNHMKVLKDGTEHAAREGLFAARVPGSRVLTVADIDSDALSRTRASTKACRSCDEADSPGGAWTRRAQGALSQRRATS